MPLVSVILPTYNRADTIQRAIESIRNQTLQDWELLVVDDGSTDNTAELVTECYAGEPRVKIIRQENQGVSGARNIGLRVSAGEYLAFIDSDDEFLPHHLELESAFLEAHPGENIVLGELWEDFGHNIFVKHYQIEIGQWYPSVARVIGSRMLDLPPGESDDYLRVYQTREPIGEWGRRIVERLPYENVYLYRGRIFEQLRWGYLMCMQPTMIRRSGWEKIGHEFEKGYLAEDFGFTAEFCRRYTVNYLSIPVCIKHELTSDGRLPMENHVATGKTAYFQGKCMIRNLENLFFNERPDDQDLIRLLGWLQYRLAHAAIAHGQRDEALSHLSNCRRNFPGLPQAIALYIAVKLIPHAGFLQKVYNTSYSYKYALGQIWRNELSVSDAAQKIIGRFRSRLSLSTTI
ncbi:MAG: glycosyltransferase family 2 protein [Acidobacteria bacterium]|nr:glycosyltransferase family 2 protein [Acidobacteriota bacterium]